MAVCANCEQPVENVGTTDTSHWLHISNDPRAPIGSAQCVGDHWGKLASPNLEADLHARWLPSVEQMALADALLAAGFDAQREGQMRERGVFTAHLLVNKRYGFWTADVEVVPVDGVFLTRHGAQLACHNAAKAFHAETGKVVCGGWAWHSKVAHAAVWDDICSQFPERGSE